MATKPGIRVDGLADVVRSMQRYGVDAADLKVAFQRIGSLVVNRAAVLAPRLTGALASSTKASRTKNKSVVRTGSTRLPYAAPIYFGWSAHGIEPHRFLESAMELEEAAARRAVEDELNDLIRRHDLS